MSNLEAAIAAENTYRKKTKRIALKLAQLITSGTDEDYVLAKQLLPLLQSRVNYEHGKASGRMLRRYGSPYPF